MKKSLLITYYFPPYTGGISNSLYNFCQQFPTDKIVVLTNRKFTGQANFKIISKHILSKLKFVWPKWLPLIYQTYRLISQEKINLIQVGQVIPIGYIAYLFKKVFNIPYVVYIYGQDLIITRQSIRKSKLIKKVLNNSDGIIANSSFTKNLAVNLGINRGIIVAHPCPQPIGQNIGLNELSEFKNVHNLNNKKVLLTVGNLVKRKGHDNVIKAIQKLSENHDIYRYLIVGNGPDENFLENLVKKYNLENIVSFYNHVSDNELKCFYSACDIFIMPSRILVNSQNLPVDVEGFGMVFLEANMYKKPVIGGNNGGQIDAIEDGKSGLLVDATEVNQITQAIQKILNDRDEAAKMGEYGRRRVLDKFTWEIQTQNIIHLIESLN